MVDWGSVADTVYGGTVDGEPRDPYGGLTTEEAEQIAEAWDAPTVATQDPTLGIGAGLGDAESGAEVVEITTTTSAGGVADPQTGAEVTSDSDPHGFLPGAIDAAGDAGLLNPAEWGPDWLDEATIAALALGIVAVLLYLIRPLLEIGANVSED